MKNAAWQRRDKTPLRRGHDPVVMARKSVPKPREQPASPSRPVGGTSACVGPEKARESGPHLCDHVYLALRRLE